jgi:YegS/Rv2252/BmrU family lipid kinase
LNASLVVNPVAGGRTTRFQKKIEDLLRERVSLTSFTTRGKGDAFTFAKENPDTDLMVVAGGDGTFNEVINGIFSSEARASGGKLPPLALIPVGTVNVLARELKIPTDIEKAVPIALTGTPKKISLGRINGHYFSLMAGIGFDGETVCKVSERIKRISGRGAYILSGIKTLAGYNPPLIQVKIPGGTFTGFTAVVGKARYYGGNFQVTPKAELTEPLLDLCLLKSRTRKKLLRFITGVIMKNHLGLDDVIYRRLSKVEITSKDIVHVQIDGDYFGTLPARIEVVKDAIRIVC